jgi:hypothetical protein
MAITLNTSCKNYFFQISAGNAPQIAGTTLASRHKKIVARWRQNFSIIPLLYLLLITHYCHRHCRHFHKPIFYSALLFPALLPPRRRYKPQE